MAEYNRASAGAGAAREDSYVSTRGQSQDAIGGGSKYGELAPKKKPLISKDHGRAFFDSADWALCKQGAGVQKSTVAVESLSPKLKRTPHPKLPPRMPACTSGGDCDGE
uniref:cAMP-regulated phosphoprotein 19-related protein n=1 Tax=Kalanchoe fedtschenkoi TaxID=63787 RepID=A0A7N0T1W0_KALFE